MFVRLVVKETCASPQGLGKEGPQTRTWRCWRSTNGHLEGSQDEECPPIIPSAHQGLLFSPGGLGGLLQGGSAAGGFRTHRERPGPTAQTQGPSSTKGPPPPNFPTMLL